MIYIAKSSYFFKRPAQLLLQSYLKKLSRHRLFYQYNESNLDTVTDYGLVEKQLLLLLYLFKLFICVEKQYQSRVTSNKMCE